MIVDLPKADPTWIDIIDNLVEDEVDMFFLPQTDKFKLLKNLFIAVLFSTYLFFLLRRAPMSKWRRNVELFVFVAIFVVVIGLGTASFDKQPQSGEIYSYTYLIHAVEHGKVESVEISHDNSRALVKLKNTSPVRTVYLPEDRLLNIILADNKVATTFLPQTYEGLWLKALGILFSLVPLMRFLLLRRSISDLRHDVDQLKAGSDRSR